MEQLKNAVLPINQVIDALNEINNNNENSLDKYWRIITRFNLSEDFASFTPNKYILKDQQVDGTEGHESSQFVFSDGVALARDDNFIEVDAGNLRYYLLRGCTNPRRCVFITYDPRYDVYRFRAEMYYMQPFVSSKGEISLQPLSNDHQSEDNASKDTTGTIVAEEVSNV